MDCHSTHRKNEPVEKGKLGHKPTDRYITRRQYGVKRGIWDAKKRKHVMIAMGRARVCQ